MGRRRGGRGGGGAPAAPVERLSPVEALLKIGVTQEQDGTLRISPDALQRLRAERIRQATLSQVPSTPRMVMRDAGGYGVSKGMGTFGSFTLERLRDIRDRAVILQPIHSAREHQMRRLSRRWTGRRTDVGWRVVHKDHAEQTQNPPESIRPYIRRVEALLERPSSTYAPTTAALLVQLEEDLLTINRPFVEPLRSVYDRDYIVGLRPVDGALIWPTLLYLQQWRAKHWSKQEQPRDIEELYEEILRIDGQDVSTAEYCLVREGIAEAVYPHGTLISGSMLNRTDVRHAGYPPSRVEQAIELVLAFTNVWSYNASFFTRGMVTDFLLGISGDIHDDSIDEFMDTLREASIGVQHAHRPPVVKLPMDGAITKIDLKATNRDMLYDVFQALLIALTTAVYRMHPSTINAKQWDGGSGPTLSAPSQATEIAIAQEEGLRSDIDHLADSCLTPFARLCHPDLRVVWWYGPDDEEKESRIHEVRARVSMTRNEVRLEQGMRPIGFWLEPDEHARLSNMPTEQLKPEEADALKRHDQNMWNQPADPTFVNQFAMSQQEQQPQQPQPGAPDGFGGEQPPDDGFGGEQPQYPFGRLDGTQPGGDAGQPARQPPQQQQEPMHKATQRRVTVYVEEV